MDHLLGRLGQWYLALALVVAFLPTRRSRALGGAGLALALLGAASDAVGLRDGNCLFAFVNQVLVGAGTLVVLLGAVLARRWRDPPAQAPPIAPTTSFPGLPLLLGLALVSAAPHLLLFEGGVLCLIFAATRSVLRSARLGWLWLVATGTLLLGTGFLLLTTILGPGGGPLAALPAGPFSPPAERLLVLLLAGGSLLLAGLTPLPSAPFGLTLAPLAAIVLIRILHPAFPLGVDVWLAPAMLVLTVSGLAAAFIGHWKGVAVAGGLLAIWSGQTWGIGAGSALVLAGWLWALRAAGQLGPPWRWNPRWSGLLTAVAALAAFPALAAALRAQVLLSVLFALGMAAGSLIEARRVSPSSDPPLY